MHSFLKQNILEQYLLSNYVLLMFILDKIWNIDYTLKKNICFKLR